MQAVLAEITAQLQEAVNQPPAGKHAFEDASYTAPGPHPFTCATCRHYCPVDQMTGDCLIVEGPYEGLVAGADTCRFWAASSAILRGRDAPDMADTPELGELDAEPDGTSDLGSAEEESVDAIDRVPPDHGAD